MKEYPRNITTFFIGLWDLAKEKLEPLFTEIKQRGETRRQERSKPMEPTIEARVGAIIEKKIAEMGLARAEALEALEARVAVLEEKFREK
jgi:polyhydroxyalkanoate synthesis regulator phasin